MLPIQATARQFQLDQRQAEFVRLVCEGLPAKAAAVAAGYAEGSTYAVERSPAIVAAIHYEVQRRIRAEAAPIALKVLLDVCRNPDSAAGVRVDAAKTLLARAGHVEPKATAAAAAEKDLGEMSSDELLKVIDHAEKALSNRARVIDAPVSPLPAPQATDIFD